MLKIKKLGVILEKTSLYFENQGVFNPAIIGEDGMIHMFYRAVSAGNFSSIGYCQLDQPMRVVKRLKYPILFPIFNYEKQGIEDPRIVKIDDFYYLSYTAFDGINALGALAISCNLKDFYRWGIIVPIIKNKKRKSSQLNMVFTKLFYNHSEEEEEENETFVWDKNVVFFPRRIEGKLFFFHRIKPHISLVSIIELQEMTPIFWTNYFKDYDKHHLKCEHLLHPKPAYIGAGCPPIEIPDGWLMIYHAAYLEDEELIYKVHILLLDIRFPTIIKAFLPYSILSPEYAWEKIGNVDNVVFPTGAILIQDEIFLYYGAADSRIACASFSLKQLQNELIFFS